MKTPNKILEADEQPYLPVAEALSELPRVSTIPAGFPTPTIEYRSRRKSMRAAVGPGIPRHRIPIPVPRPLPGARVLTWKQDPSVQEIRIRKAFLPGHVFAGPQDARITTQGMSTVTPNVFGD